MRLVMPARFAAGHTTLRMSESCQYDARGWREQHVLFDGLTIDRRVKQIAFIEVKCGRGNLSGVQRSVREAVDKHKVFTEVWTVGDPHIPITQQFSSAQTRFELPE